jgi:hypothetical protein
MTASADRGGRKCGSWLGLPQAEALNTQLLDDTIRAIASDYGPGGPAREGASLIDDARLAVNLLSSQPLCFNLFAHWRADLSLATKYGRALWPERVDEIVAVHFEHSPGRGKAGGCFLENGTAFDAVIVHTCPDGRKGLIAIETKYHEDLKNRLPAWRDIYQVRAHETGCFPSFDKAKVWRAPEWQLWLDHLLALSAVMARDTGGTIRVRSPHRGSDDFWSRPWDTSLQVVLFSRDNEFVARAAASYRRMLSDPVQAGHEVRTLEDVVEIMQATENRPWLTAFSQRYLDFSAVDATLQILAPEPRTRAWRKAPALRRR